MMKAPGDRELGQTQDSTERTADHTIIHDLGYGSRTYHLYRIIRVDEYVVGSD